MRRSLTGGFMALPRIISEANFPERALAPVQPAAASDRAGSYTVEQLEILLQPLLVAAPQKRERVWAPAHTFAFVIGVSLALWAAIIFVAAWLL
jgi:hypothetical protein